MRGEPEEDTGRLSPESNQPSVMAELTAAPAPRGGGSAWLGAWQEAAPLPPRPSMLNR